jgi:hypothetical protein
MFFHNVVSDTHAEAGPFPHAFGGKKRLENPLLNMFDPRLSDTPGMQAYQQ